MCVDAESGALKWGVDLPGRFGTEVPLWYTGQCPLIDGDRAVIAVGGSALLAGFDLASGELRWETPNPNGYAMSHSSVMVMEVAGMRTYVYAAIGAIVGVSAEPESAGRLLWRSTDFDATVIAPSPVYAGEDRIFQTAGYGAGSIMVRIRRAGGGFDAQTLYRHRPTEGLACEQQTPLWYRGRLFGIHPKDAGALRGEFACWSPEGTPVWSSGEENRFGLGPYLLADGRFYLLREDGVLLAVQASLEGYRVLGSGKILDGPDPWAPMALAGGRLLARDSRRMVCVDLRARG
jgi:outer membrane protein assembly factor BamB